MPTAAFDFRWNCIRMRPTLAPFPLSVPVGDGVVQSDGDGFYRLLWHDAQGQLRRITHRTAERAPVSEEDFLTARTESSAPIAFSESTCDLRVRTACAMACSTSRPYCAANIACVPIRHNDFRIQGNSEFLAARAEAGETMTFLLAFIAAVSLLVGGIGIMNIMLVSVTERTHEIGVRQALGATKRTVPTQFLLEAVVLCSIGGIIGVAVGYGAATSLGRMNGWPMSVSMESVLLAVGFSAAIGMFFGVWPARRAARLDPIQALRHESGPTRGASPVTPPCSAPDVR